MQILIDPERDSEEQVIAVMRAARSAGAEPVVRTKKKRGRQPGPRPVVAPSPEELEGVTDLDRERVEAIARRKGLVSA